jgi:hypothetical protein
MTSERVSVIETHQETGSVLLPALNSIDLDDYSLDENDLAEISRGTRLDTSLHKTESPNNAPSDISNNASSNMPRSSRKSGLVGRNWLMTAKNPSKDFDFLRGLTGNSARFKFAIWQFEWQKGVLSVHAYLEGQKNLTDGTLRMIFSEYARYETRKCTREQAIERFLCKEGMVDGPFMFGRLYQGTRNRASRAIMEMIIKIREAGNDLIKQSRYGNGNGEENGREDADEQ